MILLLTHQSDNHPFPPGFTCILPPVVPPSLTLPASATFPIPNAPTSRPVNPTQGDWSVGRSLSARRGTEMLENSVPSEGVKRYAPPQQRNRAVNRRRSGERFERMGYSHGSEVEKNQSTNLRNFSTVDHHEKTCRRMVALEGCCTSDAAHLLSDRWLAALRSCNDQTLDLSERPVMYAGASGSSWGHMKLNQQMDFFAELCHEIHKMNTDTDPAIDRHGSF